MSSVAVVYNPIKVADLDELKREVGDRIAAAGLDAPSWLATTEEDPGGGMVRAACADDARLILCCGGDGTVAACAGALADLAAEAGPEHRPPALGVIPAGTGNLLARNLDLPLDVVAALDVAFGSGRRVLDVLKAGEHRFVVMAGIGFDAALIRDTDEDLKARIGWLAYLGGLVKALRGSPRIWFEVSIDGGPPLRRRGVGVLVGNVGKVQGGVAVLPDAEPDDALLDVIVLSPRRALDWPVLLWRLLRRVPDSGDQAHVRTGAHVQIRAEQELPVEFDGDFDGSASELVVEVMPSAITVCVAGPDS
jgi:diacylglycerol kinase family enzyme